MKTHIQTRRRNFLILWGLGSLVAASASASIAEAKGADKMTSISDMRWKRRVLLVSVSNPDDASLIRQRAILSDWQTGAEDRVISLVQIIGNNVDGASDSASSLRDRYGINSPDFRVLLIGKDGHVAMREKQPISADTLQGTIDAMPMRRAGQP